MPGTVRSDAWKISRRILVHNEFCSQRFPSSGGPRHCNSMKIFFPRNAIHDFFLLNNLEALPMCWKYIKYILPLEGVEIFYVDFLVKLLHTYSRSRNADVSHLKNFFLSSFYFILQVYILTFSIWMKEHFN